MRYRIIVFLFFIPISSGYAWGQSRSEKDLQILFDSVAEDDKFSRACENQATEAHIKNFGKPPIKIAWHCWEGCPTSLPKPYYPEIARRNYLRGEVLVKTIVDETGKVVYAAAAKGPKIFHAAAIQAAYHSTYSSKTSCDRLVKFWWWIRYNFNP